MSDDASQASPGTGDEPKRRAKGPTMSAARQTLRNQAIIAALLAEEPVRDVAKRYKLTVRRVQQIRESFELRVTPVDDPPIRILETAIKRYEQQMVALTAIAEEAIDTQPAAAVGAVKGYVDVLERWLELMSHVGKLPKNLRLVRQESELRRIGDLMVLKLAELEAGHSTAVEVREYWERLLQTPPGGMVIEASSSWVDERPGAEGEAA